MSTPRERLALLRNTPLAAHGASLSDRPTETTVYLECAIETADVVTGLDILDGRVRFIPGDFAAVFPL